MQGVGGGLVRIVSHLPLAIERFHWVYTTSCRFDCHHPSVSNLATRW